MNKVRQIIFLITSFCAVFFTVINGADTQCKSPTGQNGVCILESECKDIIDLKYVYTVLLRMQLPEEVKRRILALRCGFENNEPKICCCGSRRVGSTTTTPATTTTTTTTTSAPPSSTTVKTAIPFSRALFSVAIPQTSVLGFTHPNEKLLPANCGTLMGNRISNGNKTDIEQFRWMALLRYQTQSGLEFKCGGSLISSRYVLTAAHCVRLRELREDVLVSVRLGEHNIDTVEDCKIDLDGTRFCLDPVQDINVDSTVFHPEYDHLKFQNDIALIRLQRDVNFSDHFTVTTICLPFTNQSQMHLLTNGTIMGWGAMNDGKTTSNELLHANVRLVSNSNCSSAIKRPVIDAMMCAESSVADTCTGDSGGPLVATAYMDQFKFKYVQYGITSAGSPCTLQGNTLPSIYTRVTEYIRWILDNMKE